MYIERIGTEFGTLQIRQHIRSVEISGVEITNVDCNMISFKLKGLINIVSTYQDGIDSISFTISHNKMNYTVFKQSGSEVD